MKNRERPSAAWKWPGPLPFPWAWQCCFRGAAYGGYEAAQNQGASPLLLNLCEGLLRLGIFLLYIWGIFPGQRGIQRVFQYHGAEHKTIYTYEHGLPLRVENVRPFSTLHPRCGTNFLMIVMLISIFIFTFLGWPSLWNGSLDPPDAGGRDQLRNHPLCRKAYGQAPGCGLPSCRGWRSRN